MKAEQVSFAAGEISPILHARTDLARYRIGLAELVNMIVLPQGGITRRAGAEKISAVRSVSGVRLIPFEYLSLIHICLEFGNKTMHVWQKGSGGYTSIAAINTPYALSEVRDLRYVQSGNVMFLTHKNHKPQVLRRNSLTSWSIEALNYKNGPWINNNDWASGAKLRIVGAGTSRIIQSIGGSVFTSNVAGSLLKVEYAVNAQIMELTSSGYPEIAETKIFEVKGTLNVTTTGEWRGLVMVDRSIDGGASWVTIRQYRRTDTEKQGQWDFTISEAEENIVYRVRAWHETLRLALEKERVLEAVIDNEYDTETNKALPVKTTIDTRNLTEGLVESESRVDVNVSVSGSDDGGDVHISASSSGSASTGISGSVKSTVEMTPQDMYSNYGYVQDDTGTMTSKLTVRQAGSSDDTPAIITVSVSGYIKKEIYRIIHIRTANEAIIQLDNAIGFEMPETEPEGDITLWSMGAWGSYQGYPRACAMYQDRLILAGSNLQPQTVWMSCTGDYADFGTSDPLRDDDAVSLTLAGARADGIHSLIGEGALLAFTRGGEWLIRGNGDSGGITPTALTAKQQSNIGTKDIQPFTAGGNVILVQSQGQKVFALGYDLNTDGYTGSELSIMSRHIFKGKQIIGMAYQSEPDSLLWFVLDDGTCAVCTYNPEHEVIGWSRQELPGKVNSLASMSGTGKTELVGEVEDSSGYALISMKDRTEADGFTDWDGETDSRMRTLRVIAGSDEGSPYTSKELISRLIVSVLETGGLWAAPGDYSDEERNWERRRKVAGDNTEYIQDLELELDNGFSSDACIQIRSMEGEPLTIAGITPIVTAGG